MKKNNEELKHQKEQFKMTKKHYFIIIIPIVLIIILTGIIAYYVFIYENSSNKLKRNLLNQNYICNKETCSINVDDNTEIVDYKTGILTVTNVDYTYIINQNYVTYQDNNKELVCTYRNNNYDFYKQIDKSFTQNTNCEVYIPTINKTIKRYQEIFDSSKINVNDLKK